MKLITGRRLAQACVVWPAIFVTTTFIMFYSFNSRYALGEDQEAPCEWLASVGGPSAAKAGRPYKLRPHVDRRESEPANHVPPRQSPVPVQVPAEGGQEGLQLRSLPRVRHDDGHYKLF